MNGGELLFIYICQQIVKKLASANWCKINIFVFAKCLISQDFCKLNHWIDVNRQNLLEAFISNTKCQIRRISTKSASLDSQLLQ